MPPPSPTTSHHHAPLLLTLSLIFLPPFLYTRGHYQNYNLQIYKATNTNRCNINGVCLMVLAKEDINYPFHACGSVSLGLMCMKRRIHINLHGKQGNKVACNIDLEDINFCLGTCNMGLWPCIQKWSPIKLSRYHLSDKILEISLVFTHGNCMGQSQQVFCKKMHLDVPCMHVHLASFFGI